jgi:hypothetical protein
VKVFVMCSISIISFTGTHLNTLETLQLHGDKKGRQINDSNTANDNNIFDIELEYDIT